MIRCDCAIDLRASSPKGVLKRSSCLHNAWHYAKKLAPLAILIFSTIAILHLWRSWPLGLLHPHLKQPGSTLLSRLSGPTIIVITPTHKRPERLADMTRFSQTLSHISNLHWIVVEDAPRTVPAVERILRRTGLPYVYFAATTEQGMPRRGWTHRNRALQYVRENYRDYKQGAVVYFADDDNSYDVRLFDNYIRKVKRIGIWAVGLSGGALVEAPNVVNKTIVGWNVVFAPNRAFATDMAGFAINLDEILRSNATFSLACAKRVPEPCFLSQFGIKKEQVEPFGFNDSPKEVLVWHTKTRNIGTRGERHGYEIE